MKFVQNLFDATRPAVTTGKLKGLYPLHNALETMFFVPNHNAHSGAHVRDAIDMKRTMVTVIFALVPALIFGLFNAGYQHHLAIGQIESGWANFWTLDNALYGALKVIPMIAVTYIAGLAIEIYFAYRNKHAVNEGFLVSGILIPLIMPIDIPLWMVAVSTAFAVLFGKEVFEAVIPRNIRLAEAPSFGKPIILYDVASIGAQNYMQVAQELIATVEISALPSNVGPVFFLGDDGSDVPWIPGEYHTLNRINLGKLQVKGSPGDAVSLIGGSW